MEKKPLTQRQQEVLQFIRAFFSENDSSPLLREIQQGCSIASYKSVVDRLNALERKGYISRLPNKHRGIQLIDREGASGHEDTSSDAQPALHLAEVGTA